MLEFIINILSTPAILVGLMSLLGLALQRKPIEDIVKGTVKTIVGFLVLSAGASFLQSGSLNAFGDLFNYAFSMQGVVPNNEAIVSLALKDFATDTAYIMCLGMVFNIIMARFSRMHYIFLTGHHTLYMACMLAVILNVGGLTSWQLWLGGVASSWHSLLRSVSRQCARLQKRMSLASVTSVVPDTGLLHSVGSCSRAKGNQQRKLTSLSV